jgi:hypothetical protein
MPDGALSVDLYLYRVPPDPALEEDGTDMTDRGKEERLVSGFVSSSTDSFRNLSFWIVPSQSS